MILKHPTKDEKFLGETKSILITNEKVSPPKTGSNLKKNR